MQFHQALRNKLDLLKRAGVRFDTDNECFLVHGRRKRGLTKLLKSLLPVPLSARIALVRGSTEGTEPLAESAQFAGRVMARCGHCTDAVRLARAHDPDESSLARRLLTERNQDRAHGLLVDHQIDLLVRYGQRGLFERATIVDPCVGTLIEQLNALDWAVVASQVPIYQPSTDVATAIDLLCTDRRSRRELHLIEIKASSAARQSDENCDNYERERGIISRSILSGLPQSYYARHQLQLLVMNETVREQFGFTFDSASVMRVTPGKVVRYRLAPKFAARAKDINLALGIKTGRTKRKAASAALLNDLKQRKLRRPG